MSHVSIHMEHPYWPSTSCSSLWSTQDVGEVKEASHERKRLMFTRGDPGRGCAGVSYTVNRFFLQFL